MADPKQFEHYQVLERDNGSLWELGRGAMGVTYKAFDTDLHCVVALKVINPAILNTEGTEQRFLREARAAAQLRHPNIATVLRLGKTPDETHFYAMEFCQGDTVEQLVNKEGPLPLQRALEFALQVTRALAISEEHHVVHRDIKPSNLIVTNQRDEGSVIKVIDFGLAKSFSPGGTAWTSMTLGTAGFIGTAHFSSPEQLEEGAVDVRSDIYSLGATLWFMLSGKPLFSGSVARVMSQHLSALPPWEQLAPFHVPEPVRQLLGKMLAKNPKDRPQSAIELRRELQNCSDSLRSKTATESDKEQANQISTSARETTVLSDRWKLIERVDRRRGQLMYLGADLTQDGRNVDITLLDRHSFTENSAAWNTLRQTVAALSSLKPTAVLRPIEVARDATGQPYLVSEWANALPILTVLRRRGSLTFRETLQIAEDLAPVLDATQEHGIHCAPFAKEQVSLQLPHNLDLPRQLDQLLQNALTDWPEVQGIVDLTPLGGSDAGATLSSMHTTLPGSAQGEANKIPSLCDFGVLIYELLGGVTNIKSDHYVPLARLSAEGNELLKRLLLEKGQNDRSGTAVQLVERLKATAGFEPLWKPTPTPVVERVVRSLPAPLPAARAKSSKQLYIAAAAIVAGGVLAGTFWLSSRPNPQSSAQDVSAAATATPVPAAVVTPAAAQLPGYVVFSQSSPRGGIKEEHRRDNGRLYIYLISNKDPTKTFLFPTYTEENDKIVFSPDETWLVLLQGIKGAHSSAQLFYRIRPNDVQYDRPEEFKSFPFTDRLWQFYLKQVGMPENTLRTDVVVTSVEWPGDSAVTIQLNHSGPAGEKLVPRACDLAYSVTGRQFSSLTDVAVMRSAIAAQATPSPTPAIAQEVPSTPPTMAFSSPSASSQSTPGSPESTPFPGEKFPSTRYLLSEQDLETWSQADLQYAINEIFARHGAAFPDKATRDTFRRFAWYHPEKKTDFNRMEAELPEVERSNIQTLGRVRDSKKVQQKALEQQQAAELAQRQYWAQQQAIAQQQAYAAQFPMAQWSNIRGFVISPYAPEHLVNVENSQLGALVQEQGGAMFRMPDQPQVYQYDSLQAAQGAQILGGLLQGLTNGLQNGMQNNSGGTSGGGGNSAPRRQNRGRGRP